MFFMASHCTQKRITDKDYDERTNRWPLEHWIKEYFQPEEEHKEKRLKEIISALSPKPREKILDVGCGLGPFVFHINKTGAKCFGIDYSIESLKAGKKILKKISPKKSESMLILSTASSLPFRKNTFDRLLNADFLEHIYNEDKDAIIMEMARVLKPKGIALSYTPNRKRLRFDYFTKKFLLALQGKRLGWQKSDKDVILFDTELHVGLSNAEELKKLFIKNGFKIKKTDFIEYSFPLVSKIFPSIRIMPGFFGAYLLVIAEKP